MKTNLPYRGSATLIGGLLLLAQTSFATAEYEQNIEKSFSATAGGKLTIEADRGSIDVTTDGSDKVEVRVLRQIKGGTKAEADKLFANHEVILEQNGNTISVTAKNKKEQNWSWSKGRSGLQVRYQVSIPRKFDVKLKTYGDNNHGVDLDGNIQ